MRFEWLKPKLILENVVLLELSDNPNASLVSRNYAAVLVDFDLRLFLGLLETAHELELFPAVTTCYSE